MGHFELPAILPGFTPSPRELPNRPVYGPEELRLFQRFNRGDFAAYTGMEPPRHVSVDEAQSLVDAGRSESEAELMTRIKRWADLTVKEADPDAEYVYQTAVVKNGKPNFISVKISNRLATWINLPGQYNYPKWIVAPTDATVVNPDGSETLINPRYLSTIEQAKTFKIDLGALGLGETTLGGQFTYNYPSHEARRMYYIVLASTGQKMMVGFLLRRKYANGLGAPGRWINPGTSPQWIPEEDQDVGEHDHRQEILIPSRELYPQEDWEVGGFAGRLRIFNRGLMPEPDATVLRRIDNGVEALKTKTAKILEALQK